jgi:undecaprenyl-diphosphatase
LYTMLIFLIFKYVENKPLKTGLTVFCVTLALAIGMSRIYLGVHYAGDVLGGWIIGFALAVFIYWLWNEKVGKK